MRIKLPTNGFKIKRSRVRLLVSAPCKNFVVDKKEEATLATVGVFIRWYVKVLPDLFATRAADGDKLII